MPDPHSDTNQQFLLDDPRPWPFSRSELLAGLRRLTGDPRLQVRAIQSYDIAQQRPSIGRVRGLQVKCKGTESDPTFELVLKEPQGTTRMGTAGVGLREVSIYQVLADALPVRIPKLIAAHPSGDWLVLELLKVGREVQSWGAPEYFLALDQLVILHDRFWGLGGDLATYTWLSRPLDSDFDIYVKAAANGVGHLVDDSPPALFTRDPQLAQLLGRLVVHADKIAAGLRQAPATFIHGDFWPGNLHIDQHDNLTIFDWQQAGIGPSVLDLVNFVQASQWWFSPLPLSTDEIIAYYRKGIAASLGVHWDEPEWESLWDYALLWTFIANWIDLVAAIPESLVETRLEQFEKIWLAPLRAAAARCALPPA